MGPPEVKSWISAKHWKLLMVVMTATYRVVGIIDGHLILQNTWNALAPSTWAASSKEESTFPRAATYSTIGWPMEVVNRISIIHHKAIDSPDAREGAGLRTP